ncbi:MAG: divalent metal cation transporter [Flavipsychrobacter sp.]|jgi:NRAMP (natural resistance-associated macrophage protein)-like metal ion transporter|nr:divalent metal cation transporter [Flavipsychrobacter sp.]
MPKNGNSKKGILRFFKKLGPGLITGASDDDPSGITTYTQAGARYGYATLWTAWATLPLMAAIQEMCARIGMASKKGLTSVLKQYYPKWVLYVMVVFSVPAIILNIGADIAGMGAVANLVFPEVSTPYFSIGFTIILLGCIVFFSYRRIANILKYLTVVLLVYLVVPFFAQNDIMAIIKSTLIPHIEFNKEFLGILVGILGTTISPYLFFWQADMEVEELKEKQQRKGLPVLFASTRAYHNMEADVNFGMSFSTLVMFFIILTAGSVLFGGGIHKIETVKQAAEALRPLAGDMAYYLFALGVIGTGFLAIPVLAGSVAYIFSEAFGLEVGLNKKYYEARGFYVIIAVSLIAGLALNYLGISPVKALLYAAILYGLTAPVIIAIILHICNSKKIMKEHTNKIRANILGGITFLLMTAAAIALLYFQFAA